MTPSISEPNTFALGQTRGPKDRIAPRNQREAGIEFKEWEDRLKPPRCWLSLIARGAGLIVGLVAFMALLDHCYRALQSGGNGL